MFFFAALKAQNMLLLGALCFKTWKITMIEVLKKSWSEFLGQLGPLVLATLPWMLAAVALGAAITSFGEVFNGFLVFIIAVAEMVLQAMVAFAGLQALFKSRSEGVEVTSGKVFVYVIAASYIGVAIMFGMMFFVIPGIIIMAASFFAPIYILKENQGPVEAVASSASLLQGKVFHVTLLICGLWLAILAIEYVINLVLGMLPLPVILTNTVTSSLVLVVGLITLPVMVNLQSYLVEEHNKKIQPTPEGAG